MRDAKITYRQRQVLQLAAEGYTAREIGEKLGIKSRTVEAHRRDIKDRLGLHNQSELVLWAVRHGLVK